MKVVVGLSGGVDSSVAAYLLKEQGHDVIGLFMRNWNDASSTLEDECPWVEDSQDALLVAQKLDIPFQVIDLSEVYKTRIVDYMFNEYEKGRTPNPDVLCNKEIKFDIFLDIALQLGAEKVATGHYARVTHTGNPNIYHLWSGMDNQKDQSYFLCQLSQYQLSKSLFPIGGLTKPEVRKIAKHLDLVTAEKKDSQGLCFIGHVHLPDFLQQQLKPKQGDIIKISPEKIKVITSDKIEDLAAPAVFNKEDGEVVGKHDGAHFFTIGQRKGLKVGGQKEGLFVITTDIDENIVYVGEGSHHPGLYRKALFIKQDDIHWVREDLALQNNEEMKVMARIRYRQPLMEATLFQKETGLYILFENPVSAITAGQFAAWYKSSEGGEELLGSGVIA